MHLQKPVPANIFSRATFKTSFFKNSKEVAVNK